MSIDMRIRPPDWLPIALERAVEEHDGDLDAMVDAMKVSRRALRLRRSALSIAWRA